MQTGIAFAGLQVSHASSTSIPAVIRAIISVYVGVKKLDFLSICKGISVCCDCFKYVKMYKKSSDSNLFQ